MDLIITVFVIFISFRSGHTACQFPDSPEEGYYEPNQATYDSGETISYNCNSGFHLFGPKERYCRHDGQWSDSTPFCDAPAELKNPQGDEFKEFLVKNSIDKNIITCFKSKLNTGQKFKVQLEEPASLSLVRINLPEGLVFIVVQAENQNGTFNCGIIRQNLGKQQWVDMRCQMDDKANEILIQENGPKRTYLEICEIEVYVKKAGWCEISPNELIPNGRLIINRKKAKLECAKGYRESSQRSLVCENGNWVRSPLECKEILCSGMQYNYTENGKWVLVTDTREFTIGAVKRLTCDEGYIVAEEPSTVTCQSNGTWTLSTAKCIEDKTENSEQTNLKIITLASSIVAGIAVLSCLMLVLYQVLRKRSKEVIVILNESPNDYHPHSVMSATSSEAHYDTIPYEDLPLPLAIPETPLLSGNVMKEYSLPTDSLPTYRNLEFDDVTNYTEPQNSLLRQSHDANHCGNWKQSAFYTSVA